MLKRFEVENFKGFRNRLVFDLEASGSFSFNDTIVKNGIVNKGIIYGRNGIGKTSLGVALFDIVRHLTDKEKMPPNYLQNYRNLNQVDTPVRFKYVFQFDEDEVEYTYSKSDPDFLLRETLVINGQTIVDYDYFHVDERFIDKNLFGTLKIELVDNMLSVLKYIYRNTPSNTVPVFTSMMQFCERMLWYRSLSDGNAYAGFTNGTGNLIEAIYQQGKTKEFEKYLHDNGVDYRLAFESASGGHVLMALFENGNKAPFLSLASTGTAALLLYYYWQITALKNVSLVFIDEFDAFLHYESAEELMKRLNSMTGFQTMVTTHNTNLMNSTITRPDCCFVMTDNKISSLDHATRRELREGHNLEKLYLSGEFGE